MFNPYLLEMLVEAHRKDLLREAKQQPLGDVWSEVFYREYTPPIRLMSFLRALPLVRSLPEIIKARNLMSVEKKEGSDGNERITRPVGSSSLL